jgi:hypothetical protein
MRKFVVLAALLYSGLTWAACETEVTNNPPFPAPPEGEKVIFKDGKPVVGNFPIITWMNGDGIGPEVSKATREILDHAIKLAYKVKNKLAGIAFPSAMRPPSFTAIPFRNKQSMPSANSNSGSRAHWKLRWGRAREA